MKSLHPANRWTDYFWDRVNGVDRPRQKVIDDAFFGPRNELRYLNSDHLVARVVCEWRMEICK